MPQSKEERRAKNNAYMVEYRKIKKNKDRMTEWRINNQPKIISSRHNHYENNKHITSVYDKKYSKTPQGIKISKISDWKRYGIIYDFEKLYYLYINTHQCWVCKNKFKPVGDKCADHDHNITDGENFRFILCKSCNNHDSWHKHIAANRIIKFIKYL